MDVNPYKSENDEIFENDYDNELIDLFSPASLDIEEDEWNLLVRTDHELAAQIGYFLLKRNKSLEMLISTTETCAEEHQIRANHYEKQIQYLRDSMEAQSKVYETFEKQLEDLTRNYNQMSDECRQYKERNKSLWEIVDNLEQKCEDYILELDFLKSTQTYDKTELTQKDALGGYDMYPIAEDSVDTPEKNNRLKMTRHASIDCTDQLQSDIVSLKAFAEETSRKHDIERGQRLNCEYKLERLYTENKDLKNHILLLEHRLKSQSIETISDMETDGKLSKSKSMTSLDSCAENDGKVCFRLEENNNIQYEVNESNMQHENEVNKNVSIRELFHRFNTTGDGYIETISNKQYGLLNVDINKKGDGISSPRYLSPKMKSTVRNTNDTCSTCKSKLGQRDSMQILRRESNFPTSKLENKMNENTVSNYRDMFAQIFEKLKISRGEVH